MEQVRFYYDGSVWLYSDGANNAIKTAPAGNYRRIINGDNVSIIGEYNLFSLFSVCAYRIDFAVFFLGLYIFKKTI